MCVCVCVCVCVCILALVIRHAPYYIIICDLSGSTIFFDITCISQTTRFTGKVIEHEMCVLIVPITSVGNISHSKNNSARYNR